MKTFLCLVFAFQAVWAAGPPEARPNVPPESIPQIFLEARQPITSEAKVPCVVTMRAGAQSNRVSGVVRLHGASSLAYPKKSFGLTLTAPARWLGLPEGAHWVLNAAFIDRSLMRHKLSYDLFRSLSTTNAPRFAAESRFVEVHLNGDYHGVYLLMQRVDRAMLSLRRYNSNATQHACIYKAIDHAANFDRPGHYGYEQREPDPLVKAYWGPLDELNRFASSARDRDFFDPVRGIGSRLDLDNTIDFHLLVLLTSNMDGFDKNLILARDAPQKNTPPPRFFFAPWDYDATFGRNWESSRVGAEAWLSNPLFERLLTNPSYRAKFAARWKQLRQNQFSVRQIDQLIDENVRTLGSAIDRNAKRWREAKDFYADRVSFQGDITQMKRWVRERTQWLDEEIARRAAN